MKQQQPPPARLPPSPPDRSDACHRWMARPSPRASSGLDGSARNRAEPSSDLCRAQRGGGGGSIENVFVVSSYGC
ncbi:unnamed protein product [Lampetra fluviatilis]